MRQLAAATKRFILITGLLVPGTLALTASFAAQADWLSEPELRESCEAFATLPYSLEGSSCVAFVQGFLLGSNRIVVEEDGSIEAKTEPDKETFMERAVRTRLGNSHIERINDASDVKYCIDENTRVADLVQAISDYFSSSSHTTGMTNPKALQLALADRFPCDD